MMDEDCIFCKIGAGQIPCSKVYEDDRTLAFLDIRPAVEGHTLIIPKSHSRDLTTADSESLKACLTTASKVTRGLLEWGAEGVNLLQNNGRAAGQVVDHLHFHLFPRYRGDGRAWGWRGKAYPEGQAEKLQEELRRAIQKVL